MHFITILDKFEVVRVRTIWNSQLFHASSKVKDYFYVFLKCTRYLCYNLKITFVPNSWLYVIVVALFLYNMLFCKLFLNTRNYKYLVTKHLNAISILSIITYSEYSYKYTGIANYLRTYRCNFGSEHLLTSRKKL